MASDTGVASLATFNVPLNSPVGTTGMRIRTRTSGNPNGAGDACTLGYFSGECENYTITITAAPPCSPTPVAGQTISNDDTVCYFNTFTLSLSGATVAAGITYEWQSSPDNTTWTSLPFGTNSTFTYSQYVATYYRCLLRCSGGAPSTSASKKIEMVAPVYYDFMAGTIYVQNFDNWVDACDNHDVPSENWKNTPSTGNTSWRRQDEGYTRGAWSFPSAIITPRTGSGCAAFHTTASPNLAPPIYGDLDLYLNCINFSSIDFSFWYYKVCCVIGYDTLYIDYSTNGGFTFSPAAQFLLNDTLHPGPSAWKQRVAAAIPVNNSPTVIIRIRESGDLAGTDDTGIDDVKVDGVLGTANRDLDLSNIAFMPNPSNGNVTLRCSNKSFSKSTLQLMDLTGRVVYSEAIQNAASNWSAVMDWSNQTKGIYIVKLISDTKVYTQKIVLE
ncbi:MAG: T9SS type A sorting domain-containing protein [Bacteroidetes bacterium]|nr:T9SS type A sorting domain-containing protein [Bacteroidota bacterium]